MSVAHSSVKLGVISVSEDTNAADLAEHTSETNPLGFGFGPSNVGVWRMEAGDYADAAQLAERVNPDTIQVRARRAVCWREVQPRPGPTYRGKATPQSRCCAGPRKYPRNTCTATRSPGRRWRSSWLSGPFWKFFGGGSGSHAGLSR